jgi:hypothetical protein
MKHIKIRALYFKAVKPAFRELDVEDDLYLALSNGAPDIQILQLMGIPDMEPYVRRIQIQYDGKLIYNSMNKSKSEYPCDSRPW